MLRGNLLSLSTTKYLTFSLLLKALHSFCTSSAYKFLASTQIYFHFPAVMKFSRKRADFKSVISPLFELRFNRFLFYFGYLFARNPNLLFTFEIIFYRNFQIFFVNSIPKTQNFEISSQHTILSLITCALIQCRNSHL